MPETLMLAPKLDLTAASDLMSTLQAQTDGEIVLDLSEVKHFGALCMQVIFAASTHARSQDRTISMINASDRVIDQMRVMGMTPETITRGHS